MEKETSDTILARLKEMVEAKLPPPREEWLSAAFDLEVLRLEEAKLFNRMAQEVATLKNETISEQAKKNVAAAEIAIQASDVYLFYKDQEAKLYTIDELVRLAKKSADINL